MPKASRSETITTLVRRVIDAGLARRKDDPANGRAARIELTERARAFAPVAGEVVGELECRMRAGLTEEEYRALRTGLRAVTEL